MSAREVIVHTKWSGRVNVGPEAADRILSALRAAGWEVVPQRATEAMHHAARDWSLKKYGQGIGRDASEGCWTAMLTAAAQETTDGP